MLKLNKGYKRVAVITAVILIPLVYSFFYLYAFWDPYSKLKDLPVALVNEDKGALISGSSRNAGKEIVEELKKDESLKWIETDRNEAKNGLNNRRYYAEILIPQNFSQEISTADKADKKEGLLIYTVNEKRNFLAGQVLNRGMLELKDKISRKITGEIVDNIVIEVKKLPDNLKTMEDKLGEAEEGAGKLSDGISELQKNQLSFNNGILKLKNGVMDLSIGSNKLSSGQKELFNGLSSGSVDIRKLADGSNQFSLKLSELNSGTVKLNEGASGLKEGSAALNSGLSALNSSINSPNGGLLDFANGASNFGKGLQSFGEGFSSIKGASQSMYDGMSNYSDKFKLFSDGVSKYTDSVKTLASTDKTVADSIQAYLKAHPEAMSDKNIQAIIAIFQKSNGALDQICTASDSIKTNSDALLKSTEQLKNGSKQLSDGISLIGDKSKELMNGAEQLSTASEKVGSGMKQLSGVVKLLSDGSEKLTEGSAQLYSGTAELKSGTAKLVKAYSQVNSGIRKASAKISEASNAAGLLYNGTKDINTGLAQAYNGAYQLDFNAGKFIDGEKKLFDGANKLKTGLSDGKNEVGSKIGEANDKLVAINGIGKYASEPVKMEDKRVNPVPDYGTAFSPYFMSLSLWVGSLLIFYTIYLDPEIKFRRTSRNSKDILRFFSYYLIAIVQAIVLGIIIEKGLGLDVKNNFMFYGVCILVSLTFISIMQFLIVHLGEVGKFLAILLLILQLTSCGGTFPMEIVPKFFNVLYNFMPMTYSVNALKEVISGIDYGYLARNAAILGGIMVVFLLVSFFLSRKFHKDEEDTVIVDGKASNEFSLQ